MPKNPIFKGVSAIEAAGGIDGFVRELLAESKRVCTERARVLDAPDYQAVLGIFNEVVTDVMLRRLKPDLDRYASHALADAIKQCGSMDADRMDAAADIAMEQVKDWSRELVHSVTDEVMKSWGR